MDALPPVPTPLGAIYVAALLIFTCLLMVSPVCVGLMFPFSNHDNVVAMHVAHLRIVATPLSYIHVY